MEIVMKNVGVKNLKSKEIIFVGGCYGVGKTMTTTVAGEILNIPTYSSSKLISKKNNESYGKNKNTKNISNNQDILINEVLNIQHPLFLLDGHFCLKGNNNEFVFINSDVFFKMGIKKIIVIQAENKLIQRNLFKRDGIMYDLEFISQLSKKEYEQALKVSHELKIPIYVYNMKFDENDSLELSKLISNSLKAGE